MDAPDESSPMVNVITQEPLEKAPPRVFAAQTLALAKRVKDSEKANTVACFDPKKKNLTIFLRQFIRTWIRTRKNGI